MKKNIALALLVTSFTFFSCGNDKKQSEPEVIEIETIEEPVVYKAADSDATFKDNKLTQLFKEYIHLKTALVNTNAQEAANAASALLEVFVKMEAGETVVSSTKEIVTSADIETQRTAFVKVTAEVEKLLQDGLSSGTIYKQYCPMALGNTGAYWLSESKDVYNPYFGDKMLRCGRVDAEIK